MVVVRDEVLHGAAQLVPAGVDRQVHARLERLVDLISDKRQRAKVQLTGAVLVASTTSSWKRCRIGESLSLCHTIIPGTVVLPNNRR